MKFGVSHHLHHNNFDSVKYDVIKSGMSTSNTTTSDFNEWLRAMKMVARLHGGMPPEFRRKVIHIYNIIQYIRCRFFFSFDIFKLPRVVCTWEMHINKIFRSSFVRFISIQLWLALADQHFQLKEIDWEKEQQKCMCDQSLDDNEELGIQIVKVS